MDFLLVIAASFFVIYFAVRLAIKPLLPDEPQSMNINKRDANALVKQYYS